MDIIGSIVVSMGKSFLVELLLFSYIKINIWGYCVV